MAEKILVPAVVFLVAGAAVYAMSSGESAPFVMAPEVAEKILEVAHLEGWDEHSGEAAIAINQVLFDGKGQYLVATNSHADTPGRPFVGHVAVVMDEIIWDADGEIENADTVRAWAMLDPGPGLSSDQANDAVNVLLPPTVENETMLLNSTSAPGRLQAKIDSLKSALAMVTGTV